MRGSVCFARPQVPLVNPVAATVPKITTDVGLPAIQSFPPTVKCRQNQVRRCREKTHWHNPAGPVDDLLLRVPLCASPLRFPTPTTSSALPNSTSSIALCSSKREPPNLSRLVPVPLTPLASRPLVSSPSLASGVVPSSAEHLLIHA